MNKKIKPIVNYNENPNIMFQNLLIMKVLESARKWKEFARENLVFNIRARCYIFRNSCK